MRFATGPNVVFSNQLVKCHQITSTGRSQLTATSYTIDGDKDLASVIYENDLGVSLDSSLSFSDYKGKKVKKANSPVAKIGKRFCNITKSGLRIL